ncbi:MAG TPA: hypothetical protein PLK37_01190 [Terricaulis sp.]|nr:hypothetical protein [Terricaulis sp.]
MKRILAIIALALCVAAPAFAAPLPDTLRSAGVTQADWESVVAEARAQARRAGVAEAALLAAAERSGVNLARSGRFDAAALRDAIMGQLQSQAQIIHELQERLYILARADDPEIARLLTEARLAIDEGRLDDADHQLAQAERSDLAAVAVAEARAENARARLGDAIIERGRLERVGRDGASVGVREAIAGYELALRGIDRVLAPRDWARTQFNLGIAYAILAQNGEDEARVLAIAALREASSGFADMMDEEGISRAARLIAALQ